MAFHWQLLEATVDGVTFSLVYVQDRKLRLRITGSGRIPGRDSPQPWLDYRRQIAEVWIDEGVTEIGNQAFYADPQLERIWLPGTLHSIGANAFADCPELEEIYYCGTPEQLRRVEISPGAMPSWFDFEQRRTI